MTHWCKNFCCLLNGGDLGPFPLLEELHSSGVVQCGRWMSTEEGGETLAVGQRWRTGAIRQLRHRETETTMLKLLWSCWPKLLQKDDKKEMSAQTNNTKYNHWALYTPVHHTLGPFKPVSHGLNTTVYLSIDNMDQHPCHKEADLRAKGDGAPNKCLVRR